MLLSVIQLVIPTLILLMFAFWIWMFMDCMKRDFKIKGDKVVWLITIMFGYMFGAMAYFFVAYAEDKKKR